MGTDFDRIRRYYARADEAGRLDSPAGAACRLAGLVERATAKPHQVSPESMQEAARTRVFRNAADDGFQEGYYPEPGEMTALFQRAGFEIVDLVSLRGVAFRSEAQIAALEPTLGENVLGLVEDGCRDPAVVATAGHAVLVGRKP